MPEEPAIDSRIIEALRERAQPGEMPGGPAPMLSCADVSEVAERFGLSGWQVEAAALSEGMVPRRYSRSMNAVTPAQQATILSTRVALVGLGGLGGTLLDQLARTGFGRIRAVDGDIFEESNLNRQALSTMKTVGTRKAEAAAARCAEINPSVEIESTTAFLDRNQFTAFLQDADIAVDALGGLRHRLALQEAAAEAGIPLVTGALAGWTGYIGTVMPGQIGPASIMGTDNSAEQTLGCPAPTVSLVASIMAAEVVALATNRPASLSGNILVIDLDSGSFEKVSL